MSRRDAWLAAVVTLLLPAIGVAGASTVTVPESTSIDPATLPAADRSLPRLIALRRERLVASGFERRTLGDDAERIVYFVAGDGPPLVLLPGAGDQAGTWFDVAASFTDRYRVVAPDLPGHGESPPSSGPLAMSTVVAGAERLLAEVAKERPAIVVGNSMGAWIATLLALRQPGSVERLVLIDGGALPGPPGAPSLLPTTREAAAYLMATIRDPAAPPTPDWLLDELVRLAPAGATARLVANLPDLFAHLLVGRLGEVKTPVDLLWGASDRLMTVAYAEQMQAQLPAARLTKIEHCGHVPQLECPRRFAAALAGVLAAPPPAAASKPATELDE